MKLIMSQFPVRRIAMHVPKAVFVNCNLPSNFLEANMLLSFIKYHLINLSTNVTKFVLDWLFLCCTNDSWQLILYCWKNCVTFERKTHLWVEQQCMWVVPMKILPDPLCQFQTAHPAVVALVVGFFFELLLLQVTDNQVPDQQHLWAGRMPCFTDLNIVHAIEQLQIDVPQNRVVVTFGKSPSTISKFKNHRESSADLQSRFEGWYGRLLSTQPIWNRLHITNLWAHRGACRPEWCIDRVRTFGEGSVMVGWHLPHWTNK